MLLSPPVPERSAPEHRPVLLDEAMARLGPGPGRRMLDCTLGLGGHAEAMLEAGASVMGVDRDSAARSLAAERLGRFGGRFSARAGTFAEAARALAEGGERFDGVLADIGVSSMQLDDPQRGFSIRSDAPVDMRMGDGCPEDALALIDRLDESELADVIYTYGEERLSRRIARAIKRTRAERRLVTCAELAAVVRAAVPGHAPRHPALRTFQALRIAVNDELGELERLLAALPDLLVPGGTAVVITFHSLEDRLVKTSFRALVAQGRYREAARSVTRATAAECEANPRASSAKLRWATAASSPRPTDSADRPGHTTGTQP
jgi:16S rRNA (cytosine1402-N4)-methyltransferase